ncbi:MAG: nucleotidyltransferase domain-containing protein [Cytophagales bacterium]|nr:nucleotidyltransferase domain-containing protein [Cytophagales bacterium]
MSLKIFHIKHLQDYFKALPEIKYVWLFGSYAKGLNDKYSDIDLLVEYDMSIKLSIKEHKDSIEKITKIKTQIVPLNGLDVSFLNKITPHAILIYTHSPTLPLRML